MHYQRWRRFGDVLEDKPPHERRRRKPRGGESPPCLVDGCDRPNLSRGWCQKHYSAWQRHGDPLTDLSIRRGICEVEGCDRTWLCKRMCQMHYRRFIKHGDPLFDWREKDRVKRAALDWRNLEDVAKIAWRLLAGTPQRARNQQSGHGTCRCHGGDARSPGSGRRDGPPQERRT